MTVLKPVYLRWWFIIGSIFLLTGSVYLFFRRKNQRLKRQKEKLEQEVQYRIDTILRQQKEIEVDKQKIKKQAKEIEMLGKIIRTSQMSPEDAQWLKRLEGIIDNKLSDPNFRVQDLAIAMHLSRSQFTRKLKALTDLTPGAWLQETRLQRAKKLLELNGHDSIKAVAYEVGINPSYFAEAFKKRFGKLPSEH